MFAEGTRIKPKVLQRVCSQDGQCLMDRVKTSAEVKACQSLTTSFSPVTKVSMPVFKLYAGVTSNMSMVSPPYRREMTLTVDITIAYYPTTEIPPTLYQIFCLPSISPYYKFHVHVRRYQMKEVTHFVKNTLTKVTRHDRGVESMAYGSLG